MVGTLLSLNFHCPSVFEELHHRLFRNPCEAEIVQAGTRGAGMAGLSCEPSPKKSS